MNSKKVTTPTLKALVLYCLLPLTVIHGLVAMTKAYAMDIELLLDQPAQAQQAEATVSIEQMTDIAMLVADYLDTPSLDATKIPAAYLVSKKQLIELTCPEQPLLCAGKVAIFDKRHFHILLDQTLKSKQPEIFISFIVHDLTHVYQHFREQYDSRSPCNQVLQNEREAYSCLLYTSPSPRDS